MTILSEAARKPAATAPRRAARERRPRRRGSLRTRAVPADGVSPHSTYCWRPVMPLVDLPLNLLHEYEGGNPRPADVEEYWDRGLEEMRALDPAVELVPHALSAS